MSDKVFIAKVRSFFEHAFCFVLKHQNKPIVLYGVKIWKSVISSAINTENL